MAANFFRKLLFQLGWNPNHNNMEEITNELDDFKVKPQVEYSEFHDMVERHYKTENMEEILREAFQVIFFSISLLHCKQLSAVK